MYMERCFLHIKTIESEARGRKAYEIYTRTCISFREIGRGYSHLQTFCRAMNIPPPMNANVFNTINNNLHEAYTPQLLKIPCSMLQKKYQLMKVLVE